MDAKLLYRLANAKTVAQGFDGDVRELALWFLEYLHRDTPIPETYHRWVGYIENKNIPRIVHEIGMIRKLVTEELNEPPFAKATADRKNREA